MILYKTIQNLDDLSLGINVFDSVLHSKFSYPSYEEITEPNSDLDSEFKSLIKTSTSYLSYNNISHSEGFFVSIMGNIVFDEPEYLCVLEVLTELEPYIPPFPHNSDGYLCREIQIKEKLWMRDLSTIEFIMEHDLNSDFKKELIHYCVENCGLDVVSYMVGVVDHPFPINLIISSIDNRENSGSIIRFLIKHFFEVEIDSKLDLAIYLTGTQFRNFSIWDRLGLERDDYIRLIEYLVETSTVKDGPDSYGRGYYLLETLIGMVAGSKCENQCNPEPLFRIIDRYYLEFDETSPLDITRDLNMFVEDGCISIIEYICEKAPEKIDINKLMVKAVLEGRLEILKLALSRGADPSYDNHLILRNFDLSIEIIEFLAGSGVDFTLELEGSFSRSMFSYAEAEVIKTYVRLGRDVRTDDDSFFKNARDSFNVDLLKFLIDYGLDVGDPKYMALMFSEYSCQINDKEIEFLKVMIENGADHRMGNDKYLRLVFRERKDLSLARFLIQMGCDITSKDNYCIKAASHIGFQEGVEFLIDLGADLHSEDDYAIRSACRNGHLKMVEILCKSGSNVNAYSSYPLRVAEKHGRKDICEVLISFGASL